MSKSNIFDVAEHHSESNLSTLCEWAEDLQVIPSNFLIIAHNLHRFLGSNADPSEISAQKTQGAEASKAASDSSQGTPKYTADDITTDKNFANEGLAYARDVEVNNGRWAMIGWAILIEYAPIQVDPDINEIWGGLYCT